jgi:RNA polymerase sigma factor, sigma-70 family
MLKNRMDAEDITQEVFIKIWKYEDNFNILSAKTWIMRTTHNLCIDYLRKRSVLIKRSSEITDEMESCLVDTAWEGNPSLKFELGSMNFTIKAAVKKLPENLRSVFVLYEIDGLKYREISKTLDMPVNSVKVNLMRARIRLQEELKNYV